MRAIGAFLRVLTLLVIVCAAGDADVPIPPAPAQWATDTAGLLSPQTIADLNARLSTYERQSGHQVLVYVGTTTAPTPTEDWTVRAFEHWKVGRKGLDDGVVFFVFPRDRTARIEVGYGLEQTLPDVVASRLSEKPSCRICAWGDPTAPSSRESIAFLGFSAAKQNWVRVRL